MAIHESAMDLFAARGYRETRVADIAEAADVSEATFFRYFSCKEEVVLVELVAGMDAALAALADRPLDEPPLTAVLAVMRTAEALGLVPGSRSAFVVTMVASNRGLAGHFFGEMVRVTDRLAGEFARRLGAEPTDLEPQLLAASVIGALQAVLIRWLANPLHTDPMAQAEKAFQMLADGLA
jgi:AcrR family transcriptional regulator